MNEIANTIFEQINGNQLMYMIGGHKLTYTENSFRFKFKMCKKFNHCTITLNSKDLYNVRFCKIWGVKILNDTTFEDIYFDKLTELFSNQTGLATVMPRVIFK